MKFKMIVLSVLVVVVLISSFLLYSSSQKKEPSIENIYGEWYFVGSDGKKGVARISENNIDLSYDESQKMNIEFNVKKKYYLSDFDKDLPCYIVSSEFGEMMIVFPYGKDISFAQIKKDVNDNNWKEAEIYITLDKIA